MPHSHATTKAEKTSLFSHLSKVCERMVHHFLMQCLSDINTASWSLTKIIAMAVLIVLLLFTFWALLMGVIGFALYQHQCPVYCIVTSLMGLQLIGIALLSWIIHRCKRGLLFVKLKDALAILK